MIFFGGRGIGTKSHHVFRSLIGVCYYYLLLAVITNDSSELITDLFLFCQYVDLNQRWYVDKNSEQF